jgi:hypothetical protein
MDTVTLLGGRHRCRNSGCIFIIDVPLAPEVAACRKSWCRRGLRVAPLCNQTHHTIKDVGAAVLMSAERTWPRIGHGTCDAQAFLDSTGLAKTVVPYRRGDTIFTQGDVCEHVMHIAIEYDGELPLEIHNSLLSVVLHD